MLPFADEIASQNPRCASVSSNVPAWPHLSTVEASWHTDQSLDQGLDGGCVGFAWVHDMRATPAPHPSLSERFAREHIYWRAQQRQDADSGVFPGARLVRFGTSVLSGAEVLREYRYFREFDVVQTIPELLNALRCSGPAVLECEWQAGLERVDDGRVSATGHPQGRHCVLLHEIRRCQGSGEVVVVFQNSRGPSWGLNGHAMLSVRDLAALLPKATVCVPGPRARVETNDACTR